MNLRVIALALFLSSPLPALAADPAPSIDDQAKAAYREASAEYALGHYRDALAKFELAFKLKQLPGLLFNIAQCHRQLKQFEQAATTYRSFIRLDPQNPQVDRAKELLVQVDEAVRLQDRAQAAPPLDANGHDAPPARAQVAPPVPTIRAVPEVAAKETPAPAAPASERPRIATWIAAGAAVVALGVGTVSGLQSKGTASDISGSQHTRAEQDALQSQLNSQSSRANLLFAVAGGLAVATGVLFVLHF